MKTWKLNPSHKDPGSLILLGPYDADFVEELKARVPTHARAWRATSKSWLIDDAYEDEVRELIAEHTRAEAPSDLVGLPAFAEDGRELGKVSGIGPHLLSSHVDAHLRSKARLVATIAMPFPTVDAARELVEGLGEGHENIEVWEALELLGDPKSVTVRRVDGKLVIFAEVAP